MQIETFYRVHFVIFSTIIEIFSRQILPARSTTHSTYPTDLTAQIRSMIMTLHTLSLASITHHTNSPRVRLRRPPRARPQLTRPPLPAPVLRRPLRPSELRQSARLPVLAARCLTIARHPPPDVPPTARAHRSSPGCRCSATARRTASRPPELRQSACPHSALSDHRPPPAARHASRRECGRSSPGRRCSATARRPPPDVGARATRPSSCSVRPSL